VEKKAKRETTPPHACIIHSPIYHSNFNNLNIAENKTSKNYLLAIFYCSILFTTDILYLGICIYQVRCTFHRHTGKTPPAVEKNERPEIQTKIDTKIGECTHKRRTLVFSE
jgi:hypothetical protein